MTRKAETRLGLLATLVLALVLTAVFHGKLVGGLNTYLLGDYEDGLKNYYTFLYHVEHDTTWSHFGGMNYPHGEQVVFSDNQPILSNTVKAVSAAWPGVTRYGIAIINGSMLFSLVLSCLLLFLLLRHYRLPVWLAVAAALGVGFLAPQLTRMGGHYGLAHCFVIPLVLWLCARWDAKPSISRSLLIALAVWVVSGLHFYYFALTGFFLSFWFLFRFAAAIRTPKKLLVAGLHWVVQVVLPFVLLQAWFLATDTVHDRPSNPYGFLVYKAQWETVLLPLGYWLESAARKLFTVNHYEWEGIAYVGLAAVFFVLLVLVRFVVMLVRRQWQKSVNPFAEPSLNATLAAGVALLLFSFGWPFVFGLEWLLEYSGPLKQFRGIGRFAWVFYYAVNVAALVFLYRALLARPAAVRYSLLGLLVLVLGWEAAQRSSMSVYHYNTIPALQAQTAPWLEQVQPQNYQAIVPVPYFHVGSENVGVDAHGSIKRDAMTASLLTGLPITAVAMSRTSLQQTLHNVEFAREGFGSPAYWSRLPNNKPFLFVIRLDENGLGSTTHPFASAGQPNVLFASDSLLVGYATPLELRTAAMERQDRMCNGFAHGSYFVDGALRTNVPYKNYVYNGFDTQQASRQFHTSDSTNHAIGALESTMQPFTQLFAGTLPLFYPEKEYECSFWVFINEDLHATQRVIYEEKNAAGEVINYINLSVSELLAEIEGDWGRVAFRFTPAGPESTHLLHLQKDVLKDRTMWADELLIRPLGTNVFSETQHGLLRNNSLQP